ncbi:hypothetical protein ACORG1_01145 [Mycobacterium sp. TJFP1]|jgi:hypothetical protein|uniref:hypothetical protein n=1 Tax=Mycolicibacterium TaxID=1866885 RepID=UPI00298C2C4A|nr:hypothetical protein [Mycolicibacterium sp. D5.8-2]MDW5610158.1 hypothetical protein [Mycolicibacterium sp. D5.8-2]
MTKVVVVGAFLIVVVQMLAVTQLDRDIVLTVTGGALACVLIAVRTHLTHQEGDVDDPVTDEAAASMRRWLSRTETLISWSESSRSDWDRRLRPMLARQFELAAGRRKIKDPRAFDATGRMVFGDELWLWVDPENISRTGGQEQGPGRRTLDEILQRLEKL